MALGGPQVQKKGNLQKPESHNNQCSIKIKDRDVFKKKKEEEEKRNKKEHKNSAHYFLASTPD